MQDLPPACAQRTNPPIHYPQRQNPPHQVSGFSVKRNVLEAEVIWTLQTVESYNSLVSNNGINETFQRMFKDSLTAQQCSWGVENVIPRQLGLAPYMSHCLEQQVKNHEYVILFDDSMNAILGTQHMDLHVRIWDVNGVLLMFAMIFCYI